MKTEQEISETAREYANNYAGPMPDKQEGRGWECYCDEVFEAGMYFKKGYIAGAESMQPEMKRAMDEIKRLRGCMKDLSTAIKEVTREREAKGDDEIAAVWIKFSTWLDKSVYGESGSYKEGK